MQKLANDNVILTDSLEENLRSYTAKENYERLAL